MKMTFLSKWTVLLLTIVSIALAVVGALILQPQGIFNSGQNILLGIVAFVVAFIIYAFAWIVALLDSIQERRWGWLVVLIILLPVWIGPVLYALIGPKNTK
jgi:hypothetical protein